MLAIPKAHKPKQQLEKASCMVTKVEKSYEMNIWLNPKYSQQWVFSNETPKIIIDTINMICYNNHGERSTTIPLWGSTPKWVEKYGS